MIYRFRKRGRQKVLKSELKSKDKHYVQNQECNKVAEYTIGHWYCIHHKYVGNKIIRYHVNLDKIINRKDDITELIFKERANGIKHRTFIPISDKKQYGIVKIEQEQY